MATNLITNYTKDIALIIFLLILNCKKQTMADAIIVSLPHQLYVLEGDRGTVRCQNRSMDQQNFYSYVSNAVWWRLNPNGTDVRMETTGDIYSSRYTLNFNPFSSEHQGDYYCCLPDNSSCSNISTVVQSTAPSIRAFNSSYTAVVGSQVTMECDIINPGVPTATIGWSKSGIEIFDDISSSNSSMAITLKNVTMEDDGVYTCIARNVFSYNSDHIELRVIQQTISEYLNDSLSQLSLRVLAEDISTTCQIFQVSAPVKLESFIYKQYDHNVTINTTKILCNDDESVAICDFQFTGPSAKTALQLFVNDLTNSSDGLDLSIYRLRLCLNCSELNVTIDSEEEIGPGVDKSNDKDNNDMLTIVILSVIVMVLLIVTVLLCLVVYFRCRKKRKNIAHLSMQKCVIPTVSSPGQYSTLQFNYDTEHNLPASTLPLMPNKVPSLVHLRPSNGHQNQNMKHSTGNFEIHSDHKNTISQDVNSNNGYVLPDNAVKLSPTTDAGMKSTDKINEPNHRPTVILKSDGTGIIKTGTLQVMIPSSRSDENYTVTPSQTHESYFDIVKNT